MHYYQHNIGDYRKDTAHLSLLEHGIYRQLLDTYYLTEQPLSTDKDHLMRTHCVRSADEMRSMENVLDDFFELTENGYIHSRCDDEILKFQAKSEKAKQSANARWSTNKSKRNANGMRTHSEGNANGMLTNNHKPITNNQYKEKVIKRNFKPPTEDEVFEYCQERQNEINPEQFIDFYESKGWMVGSNKMKDWKSAIRNWEKRHAENVRQQGKDKQSEYLEELKRLG